MIDLKKYITDFINKLKENPGTLFGLLYPYLFIIIVVIGLNYISNLDEVAQQKVPPVIAKTITEEDLAVMPAKTIPPIDVFEVKDASQELMEKGKELYNTICASCHNESGAGGGPAAVGLNPAPRNLTSPAGWVNGMKFSEIYTTLQEGIEGTAMISYDFLIPEERIAIAHYIRSEFIADPPEITNDELTALDQTYNLSEGMDLPAQIPVKEAMNIVIRESESKILKVENAINKVMSDEMDTGAKIFNDVSIDEKLALSALVNSNDWKVSAESFIQAVTKNINHNGFNGKIFRLSESELVQLYNYLNRIL
jgi:mono/diheme cytochrome c family protein